MKARSSDREYDDVARSLSAPVLKQRATESDKEHHEQEEERSYIYKPSDSDRWVGGSRKSPKIASNAYMLPSKKKQLLADDDKRLMKQCM